MGGDWKLFEPSDWRSDTPPPLADRRTRPRRPQTFSVSNAEAVLEDGKVIVAETFNGLASGRLPDIPQLRKSVDRIALVVEQNPYAAVTMTRLKTKHEYTFQHSVAVSALMMALARSLGMQRPAVRQLGLAGLLHDIGKSKIPNELLDKPTALEPEERALVVTHAERGFKMLYRIGVTDEIVLSVCRHHHERLDGSGYPDNLAGEALSQSVRIAAICDVFDALTSSRAYKEAWTSCQALEWMMRTKGQFDSDLLMRLRSLLGAFPAGTYVRLQSDRLGTVVANPLSSYLSPQVTVDRCASTNRSLPPRIVDTAYDPIVAVELTANWKTSS